MKKPKLRFFTNRRGEKIHRVIPVFEPTPLAQLDAAGWTVSQAYLLHVAEDGAQLVVPDIAEWDGRSLTVRVEAIGDGWIHESTRVGTIEEYEGVILRYRTIPPHGPDWERDEETDRDYDKWTAWKRQRKLGAH